MAYFVGKWNRGVLPVAAGLAILFAVVAAVAGPAWFARDKAGFNDPALEPSILGLLTLILVPVQLLLIAFAMRGFQQQWSTEVEVSQRGSRPLRPGRARRRAPAGCSAAASARLALTRARVAELAYEMRLKIALSFGACGFESHPGHKDPVPEEESMEASRIDAFAEAEALVDEFGPRPPGSDAERRAAQHLAEGSRSSGGRSHLEGFSVWPRWATAYAINAGVAVVGGVLAVYAAALGTAHRPARADRAPSSTRRHRADHPAAARPAGVAERRLVRRARAAGRARPGRPLRQRSHPHLARSGTCSSRWWSSSPCASLRVAGMSGVALTVVQFLATVVLIVYVALMLDIALSPASQGESDNASGVGVVLRLAERLTDLDHFGVHVVFTGAQKARAQGMRAFLQTHRKQFKPERDDRHQRRRRRRRRAPGDEEGGAAPDGQVAPAAHRQPRLRPVRQPRGERRLRRRVRRPPVRDLRRHHRPARGGQPRGGRGGVRAAWSRRSTRTSASPDRELGDPVERLGVGERVAADAALSGAAAQQDLLHRHLELLVRERARHLGDLDDRGRARAAASSARARACRISATSSSSSWSRSHDEQDRSRSSTSTTRLSSTSRTPSTAL